MAAKDVKKMIISLIILAIGIFILAKLGKSFTQNIKLPSATPNLAESIDSLSTLFMLVLAVIIIILIPVYFSKRSAEKKYGLSETGTEPKVKR